VRAVRAVRPGRPGSPGGPGSTVATLRCLVGGVLLAAPDVATSGDTGRRILVRTIGIRDVILGAGTLLAARDGSAGVATKTGATRWLAASLASDAADVLLALASRRELGLRGTWLAAITPVPFVASGVRTLARRRPC
jgi:hypothetical protein